MSRMVIVGSGRVRDAELGIIHYVVRPQAKRFIARWKTGELQLTLPPRVSEEEFRKALDDMRPRLLAHKPSESKYYFGQVIDAGEFRIVIESLETNRPGIQARRGEGGWALYVPENYDIQDQDVEAAIGKIIRKIANVEAPNILIPRAHQLADEVGRHPMGWSISKGQRTLGRCDSQGCIALSCLLVLYPPEIRDFVIYHELAHLSEMNHSPRFHELCNQYCHGREHQLDDLLKTLKLPI